MKDEIIAEVWRNRDAFAKAQGYDLDKMVKYLQKRQAKRKSQLVDRRRQRRGALRATGGR